MSTAEEGEEDDEQEEEKEGKHDFHHHIPRLRMLHSADVSVCSISESIRRSAFSAAIEE